MSMHDRAAQFSPFAAMTGYDDAVEETARLTNEQCELTARRLVRRIDEYARECVFVDGTRIGLNTISKVKVTE